MRARGKTLRAIVLASCAAALVGIALPSAVTGAPGGKSAASLRAHRAQLAQRSHSALLELYSIDTRLERARTQISTLDRQATRLRQERAALKVSLRLARRTITVTQRNLADRARAVYESGDVNDPIAILLGAVSVDDAVTRLENIRQIANQQNATLRQAREAQSKLLSLKAGLAQRTAALTRLRYSTLTNVKSLEAARAAKASTIHRLSSARALTGRQLASLSKQATKAATTSVRVENSSASTQTTSTSTTTTSTPPPSGGSISKGRTLTVSSTCYCLTGGTASGLPVGPGIIATDPSVIPLGTRVFVPGYGKAVAADTGSAVKGLDIDLWVASCAQARAYGRRTVTITIL